MLLSQKLMAQLSAGGQPPGPEDSGPGPAEMIAYDASTDTGYYGVALDTDLITGDALASQIGLSAGNSINSTGGWLKFWVGPNAACNRYSNGEGYVLFIAKKTFRHSLSWSDIDNAKPVDGSGATESISGYDFKVRLLTGTDGSDLAGVNQFYCSDDYGAGSEWNALMYRVHTDVPTCSDTSIGTGGNTDEHGGPQTGANWNDFSDPQVYLGNLGSETWFIGSPRSDGYNLARGSHGIATLDVYPSFYPYGGWRPALELVS